MDFFHEILEKEKKENLFREIKNIDRIKGKYIYIKGEKYLDFSSNNYLGLRDNEEVKQAVKNAIDKYGLGSGAGRLISGTNELYTELEEKISKFKKQEKSLIYNSGYDANLGVISSVMDKNDVVFSDRLNHASIIDGIFLSKAKMIRYKHNDIDDLRAKLKKHRKDYKKAMIVTDSIFSMDGDRAKLKEILALKEEFEFIFMIDEAHGSGIFGENGAGLAEEEGVLEKIDINMGTFGKAFGAQGAYIAAKKDIIDFLINKSRSFIYTTAISPLMISASLKALEIIKRNRGRRKKILEISEELREKIKALSYSTLNSTSQIIPILIGESKEALRLSEFLYENKILAPAIRTPTVAKGKAIIRLSINYNIDYEDINYLLMKLKEFKTRS